MAGIESDDLLAFARQALTVAAETGSPYIKLYSRTEELPDLSAILTAVMGPSSNWERSQVPNWSELEVRKIWSSTNVGQEILAKLPGSTRFRAYRRDAVDTRSAYYSPTEDTIYIAESCTTEEAALIGAHQAMHAFQIRDRRFDGSTKEKIRMELETKHKILDLFLELGSPTLACSYQKESEFRRRDPETFDREVVRGYGQKY